MISCVKYTVKLLKKADIKPTDDRVNTYLGRDMVDTVEEFLGIAIFITVIYFLIPLVILAALFSALYRLCLAIIEWDPKHLSDRYKM